MKFGKTTLSIALILGLPALPACAAENIATPDTSPQASTGSTPTLHVLSRETDVDVLVTDAKGRPVYGLGKSDFTILEDGRPQLTGSFAEFGSASRAQADAAPHGLLHPTHRLPPNVYTNFEATPASGPVNIILLDALNASPVLIDFAEEQLTEYLHTMPENTQVAIFWLSGSGLHMLQGFTSDPDLLLKATETDRTDFGIEDRRWTRDWITADALTQIAAYVSSIKGRKNLLWFTPNMPVYLLRDGGISWGEEDMAEAHRLMDIYEMFTAEQIAVCPIDPHGVHPFAPVQLRMQAVAQGTGGVAYYNSNDLALAVSHAIEDGSHFYTLSYVPPSHRNDGKFHRITVKVDRPGLHLVYRSGYNAEDPQTQPIPPGSALLNASLEGKAPAATQLLFDVKVQHDAAPAAASAATPSAATASAPAPSAPAQQTAPYDVLFAIPQNQIAFADGPNGTHTGTLQFAADAYDIDGNLVSRGKQIVRLNLTADQYRQFLQKPLEFHEQLQLPPGQLALRLGVLDSVSNNVGTLEISLFNWQNAAQAASAQFVPLLHRKRP